MYDGFLSYFSCVHIVHSLNKRKAIKIKQIQYSPHSQVSECGKFPHVLVTRPVSSGGRVKYGSGVYGFG